jgi:hypothetical protein
MEIGAVVDGMLGGGGDITKAFRHVFWAGDMNYRINGTREVVDKLLEKDMHAVLKSNDQLSLAMAATDCFRGFTEGPLAFRPTYKFDKKSDLYDTGKKQRIPSWTDRVLYKEYPAAGAKGAGREEARLVNYASATEIKTSDHRPVYVPPCATERMCACAHVRPRRQQGGFGGSPPDSPRFCPLLLQKSTSFAPDWAPSSEQQKPAPNPPRLSPSPSRYASFKCQVSGAGRMAFQEVPEGEDDAHFPATKSQVCSVM